MKYSALVTLCCIVFNLNAQQKHTINGYINNFQNSEPLIGANVYNASTLTGTTTNAYGFFSLTLPSDSIQLTASYIGYQTYSVPLWLDKDTTQNISLKPNAILEVVEISASQKAAPIQEQTQMSTVSIPIAQIQSLPTFLGEVDVLKALQLMPGVQSGTEGTSGLYVRGGGPDQNLILLDGVPVYNVSHLLGFFSIFNADAINSIQLIKGGFPARYGGRLSSVVAIRMKEGNLKRWGGSASIGLISSKFTLEGPLIKDRTSLIVSGRRTYIDLLLRPLLKEGDENSKSFTGYYFYDINAKINHRFSDKDRLYLSMYTGDDRFYFRERNNFENSKNRYDADLGWGNLTTVLRWNHLFSKKWFSNTTLTYSRYALESQNQSESISQTVDGEQKDFTSATYFSGIRDWGIKTDVDFIPNPNHYLKFGLSATHHRFKPGVNNFQETIANILNIDSLVGNKFINAVELDAYIEDDVNISPRFKANIGLHASGFTVEGAFYKSLQPRLSLRYLLHPNWSLKTSYAQMNQFIHLLSSSSALDLPSDLWVPATANIKPQSSHQVALGIAHTFQKKLEFSVEGYYKTMNNIIDYEDGASYLNSLSSWENKIAVGKGKAYGVEFLVQKKAGKTTGWIGYTLAWSNRHYPNTQVNLGEPFPYKYDRRHDVGITITHRLSKKVELSGNWVFGTGNAVTLATQTYQEAGEPFSYFDFGEAVQHIKGRNDYRFNNYHRLDIGVSFIKQKKFGERRFNVGLYNTYSRRNPFFLFLNEDEQGNKRFRQVTVFPILPAFSFKRSF